MSAHLVPRPYGLAARGRVAFEEEEKNILDGFWVHGGGVTVLTRVIAVMGVMGVTGVTPVTVIERDTSLQSRG